MWLLVIVCVFGGGVYAGIASAVYDGENRLFEVIESANVALEQSGMWNGLPCLLSNVGG